MCHTIGHKQKCLRCLPQTADYLLPIHVYSTGASQPASQPMQPSQLVSWPVSVRLSASGHICVQALSICQIDCEINCLFCIWPIVWETMRHKEMMHAPFPQSPVICFALRLSLHNLMLNYRLRQLLKIVGLSTYAAHTNSGPSLKGMNCDLLLRENGHVYCNELHMR